MLQHGNQRPNSRKRIKKENTCFWCGKQLNVDDPPTIDHLVPKFKGGDNSSSNTVQSCHSCNQEKGCKVKYRGQNVYKLAGIKKPEYVTAAEHCLKKLMVMQSFANFYRSLDVGEQEYIENILVEQIKMHFSS